MEILYFGNICDSKILKKYNTPYKMAQYNYEKALLDEMNKTNNIKIISLYQQNYYPKGDFIFNRKNKENIKYIKYINIPVVKEIIYFFKTCLEIYIWNKKCKKDKKVIYNSFNYLPVSLAIVIMGNILDIKKVITFTDLPIYTYSKEKLIFYKKIIIKPYLFLINKLAQSYDLYILFTKQMNNNVNKKNKPYIVIEGIYNPKDIDLSYKEKENAIVYAGKLNKEVGVGKILEVFKKVKNSNVELWLLGSGDMENYIRQEMKKDKRIKYIGFKQRKEVFEYLKKAKLLINFRNPRDEYTKYSFPSKTFEYMVSGTPILTTKLEGIPEEYEKYMYIEEYNTQKLVKKIEEIMNINQSKLNKLGEKAKKFILENKTPEKQVYKINNFLNKNII